MKLALNKSIKVNLAIHGISILVWILLLMSPGNMMVSHSTLTVVQCGVNPQSYTGTIQKSLQVSSHTLVTINSITFLIIGWVCMVIAMMLPKLVIPIRYIYARSFKHRRLSLSLLFVLGYMAVWMLTGIIMIAVQLGLHLLLPNSYFPAIWLGIIAMVWQFSPVKQQCLNRGHEHPVLAAFGWAASRDAFVFGVMHSVWCVGSAWALMLLPLLLPGGHNLAMIVVTFIMLSEHLEHPRVPRWRVDFRGRLFRILASQAQLKLKRA